MASAANLQKTASRKPVRGGAHNRDYLGLWRAYFDERPSEHVSMYSGSDGLNEMSWEILCQKIWRDQGRVSWSIFSADFSDFWSLKSDFGLSIGNNDRNTRAVLLNAQVSVLVTKHGQISRHFRSAWWSLFLSICICF